MASSRHLLGAGRCRGGSGFPRPSKIIFQIIFNLGIRTNGLHPVEKSSRHRRQVSLRAGFIVAKTVDTLAHRYHVQKMAVGHCTSEVAFKLIHSTWGDNDVYAGLGEAIEF
ncbi:MAG TPA: hypothetical protein VMB21_06160 [Candidatus Limnocylindria bacterium]|jgi:hypothetical protein|nr:hypothetical protein [Candidatus Limnocylindria bacterium]HTL67146.1 hypothetical protein [Lacunisphaera sp.]